MILLTDASNNMSNQIRLIGHLKPANSRIWEVYAISLPTLYTIWSILRNNLEKSKLLCTHTGILETVLVAHSKITNALKGGGDKNAYVNVQ